MISINIGPMSKATRFTQGKLQQPQRRLQASNDNNREDWHPGLIGSAPSDLTDKQENNDIAGNAHELGKSSRRNDANWRQADTESDRSERIEHLRASRGQES